MTDTLKLVGEFHEKFGLPVVHRTAPHFPTEDVLRFRGGFMLEELGEWFEACGMPAVAATLRTMRDAVLKYEHRMALGHQDLEAAADALGDLKYVLDGTAHFMGIPLNEAFEEIHRANMEKERAVSSGDPRSTRGHRLDIVKPDGWLPPSHWALLNRHRETVRFLRDTSEDKA